MGGEVPFLSHTQILCRAVVTLLPVIGKANVKINIIKVREKSVSILRMGIMVSHSHTAIAAPYLKSKSPFPKLSLPMNKLGIIMCTEQGDIYKAEAVTYDACSYCHWVPMLQTMISSSPYFLGRMTLCLEPVAPHTREAGWSAHNHAAFCLLDAWKRNA